MSGGEPSSIKRNALCAAVYRRVGTTQCMNSKERVVYTVYQALYRKYRPQIFDDVIGQEHITTTLKNEIMNDKTSHAYLFTGSRGTGKTTCSKIFAKAVNCPNSKDGNPCCECEICKGIDEGTILDVVEMDAASNNGVDYIRDLREEAYFAPAKAKYRVYIIDEMHMLSASAFNALLKILEEPPKHVKFILATTEVHKIASTIMSRCQRFDFKRIETSQMAKRLEETAQKEGFTLDEDAARLISRYADGGMRDALSLLDLCMSGDTHITAETVRNCSGISGNESVERIVDAVAAKDIQAALSAVSDAHSRSVDLQRLCLDTLTYFRNMMVCLLSKDPQSLVDCMPDELERMQLRAKRFSTPQVLRIISLLTSVGGELAKTEYKKAQLEMTVIKMINEELDTSTESLLSRIEMLEKKLKNGAVTAVPQPVEQPIPVEQPVVVEQKTEPVKEAAKPQKPKLDMQEAKKYDGWAEVLEKLATFNKPIAAALKDSNMYVSGNYALIDTQSSIAIKLIKENVDAKNSLKRAIAEVTGTNYNIGPYRRPVEQKPQDDGLSKLMTKAQNMDIKIEG